MVISPVLCMNANKKQTCRATFIMNIKCKAMYEVYKGKGKEVYYLKKNDLYHKVFRLCLIITSYGCYLYNL